MDEEEEFASPDDIKYNVFTGRVHEQIRVSEEKKDFDTAMDCVELLARHGRYVDRMITINNAAVMFRNHGELCSRKNGSVSFTRALGELGEHLEEIKTPPSA